jgi:hypothetical protein
MHKGHPNYTHQPLQEDLAREHFLHRLVAGSAFLFALCILPVAQYFLVGGRNIEQGQVAGISTEVTPSPTVLANISENGATLLECTQKKETDSADLSRFLDGKKKAMLRDYEAAVEPYRYAKTQLVGSGEQVATESASLDKLIDDEYQKYLKQLADVDTAVAAEQKTIEERVCPAQ